MKRSSFRFLFVGSLIKLKRVDLLLRSLSKLDGDFELLIVGDGPMRENLQSMANVLLPNHVRWLGTLPMNDIPHLMSSADCLILPSRHDGWGAVVSEALMVGTPVICSDACGSAGVVHASGVGGVFRSGDHCALTAELAVAFSAGYLQPEARERLATWAQCLGATQGALYLQSIFQSYESSGSIPSPPWF